MEEISGALVKFLFQYYIELIFMVCAGMGGITHYIQMFLKGETKVSIYEWFWKENLQATIYSTIVFFFAIVGAIAAEVVNSSTGVWAAMYSGFVTGFAVDAGFNGDARTMTRDIIQGRGELRDMIVLKKKDIVTGDDA